MSATKQLLDNILKPYEAALTFEYCLLTDTAKAPVKNDPNAVGWDIYPDEWKVENGYLEVYTNVAVKPPAGYYFGFYPRSSQTNRNDVFGNSVGVIEPDYRGGLRIRLKPVGRYSILSNDLIISDFKQDAFDIDDMVSRDKALGQIVLHPLIVANSKEVKTIEELGLTSRGSAGFGSTDKK